MKTLDYKKVRELVGYSRTTLWRMERAGRFPSRIRLGEKKVAWFEEEVIAWLQSRPRGMTKQA